MPLEQYDSQLCDRLRYEMFVLLIPQIGDTLWVDLHSKLWYTLYMEPSINDLRKELRYRCL